MNVNEGLANLYSDKLTTKMVESLSPRDAEIVAVGILAETARVRGGGEILVWSNFNENPNLLVSKLLARIIVSKIKNRINPAISSSNAGGKVAVLSIENSAPYLAYPLSEELAREFGLPQPPRIIRARKLPPGESPSPAMSERQAAVEVYPITAGGKPRTLVASISPDDKELQNIQILTIVDDFIAKGSTLKGSVQLGIDLLNGSDGLTVVPTAGLRKPEQETEKIPDYDSVAVTDVITALDVWFWGVPETGEAFIRVNDFPPIRMQNAKARDFGMY